MAEIPPKVDSNAPDETQQLAENIASDDEVKAPEADIDKDYEASKSYSTGNPDRSDTGRGGDAATAPQAGEFE
jgi:hypothetical protein